jgi:hypothetical protein
MDKLTPLMANDDRGRWSRGRRLEPSTFCMARRARTTRFQ